MVVYFIIFLGFGIMVRGFGVSFRVEVFSFA